jgi:hypothetical protein
MNPFKALWQAATLQPPPLPKAPNAPISLPGYRTDVTPSTSAKTRTERNLKSLDRLTDLRSRSTTSQVLREASIQSAELSAAIYLAIRTGIPEHFTVIGRDLDGKVDPNATALAHELLRRLTYLGAADGSFGPQQGLQSISETLARDLLLEGAACLEVALDKARIPASLNVIAPPTLVFYEEDNSFRLAQKVGGDEISLDLATVIYTSVDQSSSQLHPTSPLESSIKAIIADIDFNQDMSRVLKRAILPRLSASIDTDKLKKMTPPEILADPEKWATYQNTVISAVQSVVNNLSPEDALVSFDMVSYAYLDGGHSPGDILEQVQKVLNAKLASGVKTLPVALGFGSSANASSTESLLYLKSSDMLRRKLNEVYSRALTVAIRIMGVDGYVEFAYEELDLRPAKELEAFKSMEQSRILDLLSLGLLDDNECSLKLTGQLPPAGYTPKSGTMFRSTQAQAPIANPASGTSTTPKPDTPQQPKGPPAKAEVDPNLALAHAQSEQANETTKQALKAMQDLTYVMSQQNQKPTQVHMQQDPIELNLSIAPEAKSPTKRKVKIIRDKDGRLSDFEVSDAQQ